MTSRAKPFQETRKHHSIETAEDYTELIAELVERDGEARVGTIAKALGGNARHNLADAAKIGKRWLYHRRKEKADFTHGKRPSNCSSGQKEARVARRVSCKNWGSKKSR